MLSQRRPAHPVSTAQFRPVMRWVDSGRHGALGPLILGPTFTTISQSTCPPWLSGSAGRPAQLRLPPVRSRGRLTRLGGHRDHCSAGPPAVERADE
ncbi:hypothetical protein ACFFX0_19045 [Citricoccus parietis]|uniref:Uncharacterized protein n=1 Tax=Citricoccus parietis TaxID=592307 RepID=A0ABV5G2N7_9MICC